MYVFSQLVPIFDDCHPIAQLSLFTTNTGSV